MYSTQCIRVTFDIITSDVLTRKIRNKEKHTTRASLTDCSFVGFCRIYYVKINL